MIFSEKEERPEACPNLPSERENRVISKGVSVSKSDGETTIDVRGLQPPQPLVEIITLLESADVSDTVIVLHDRDPLLLYPELDDRGWEWSQLPSPEGELHLRLTRLAGVETQ
jgi:hypothetical protein